jgi:site-specific DNA-cytosine methylase
MNLLKEYFAAKGLDKVVKRVEHIDEKFKQNKGAWLRGPQIDRGFIPAFVSDQVIFFVHPREQRYLTFREALAIMAMPYDFNMIGDNLYVQRNHIAQNVCMSTAEVFSKEIVKMLKGNTEVFNESIGESCYYLIDHRKDDKIEIREII